MYCLQELIKSSWICNRNLPCHEAHVANVIQQTDGTSILLTSHSNVSAYLFHPSHMHMQQMKESETPNCHVTMRMLLIRHMALIYYWPRIPTSPHISSVLQTCTCSMQLKTSRKKYWCSRIWTLNCHIMHQPKVGDVQKQTYGTINIISLGFQCLLMCSCMSFLHRPVPYFCEWYIYSLVSRRTLSQINPTWTNRTK